MTAMYSMTNFLQAVPSGKTASPSEFLGHDGLFSANAVGEVTLWSPIALLHSDQCLSIIPQAAQRSLGLAQVIVHQPRLNANSVYPGNAVEYLGMGLGMRADFNQNLDLMQFS